MWVSFRYLLGSFEQKNKDQGLFMQWSQINGGQADLYIKTNMTEEDMYKTVGLSRQLNNNKPSN